jgi:hypothetical protein
LNLTISGKEEQVFGEVVNANLFDVLGVQPVIGRGFSPEEDVSPRPVALISYALWSRQFGKELANSRASDPAQPAGIQRDRRDAERLSRRRRSRQPRRLDSDADA